MDITSQKLLEQINCNLNSISLYIERLSREEIKIDSHKIYLIDYSIYEWLNIPENDELGKILEEYNQQSLNDIISDNFVEYCRKAYLQIEVLLNKFINHKYGYDKMQDSNYSKIARLKDFFNCVRKNFEPHKDKEYKTITHIMSIRDIASHADSNGKSLAERVEAKGKSIKIKLENLNNNILAERVKSIFSEFVVNKNGVMISNTLDQRYAYIRLFNLKDTYLTSDSIISYINRKSQRNILQYKLGDKFNAFLDRDQPSNELKIFFEKKDYQQIKQTLDWFIQEIGNQLK
ncbi:MAG TPA: hypothetical protein VE956_09290 [Nodularia sp. (in: cyanobacteria)]|nr:hypothetical protein [Nodularia sp. (in: cyanobacteria)]